MIKTIILGFLGIVVAFALSVMYRLGAFREVLVSFSEPIKIRILSKEHIGPYHKIVPVIEEVEAWAKARGIDCRRSFGEYFDDPRSVEEVRLRSRGGCIVSEVITDLPGDFQFSEIPEASYIKAEFTGGPSIAPYKVYPKMWDFAKSHRVIVKGSIIEVYEGDSEKNFLTTYLMGFEK